MYLSLETYRLDERRLQSLASSLALFRTPNLEHKMNWHDPLTMKNESLRLSLLHSGWDGNLLRR